MIYHVKSYQVFGLTNICNILELMWVIKLKLSVLGTKLFVSEYY